VPERPLPRQGQAHRRAVVPRPRRRGRPGRRRDQPGHRRAQRPRAGPHPAPGGGRPGPARLPARLGLRPRDGRRDHGPPRAPPAPQAARGQGTGGEAVIVALEVLVLVFMIAISVSLAAVEAAFYLLKRRRLSHVALHNRRAELVNRYLEDPPTLLMPVHIG